MKKIFLIILLILSIFVGCGEDDKITVVAETGFDNQSIIQEIKNFYVGNEVEITETDSIYRFNSEFDVNIGFVKMGDTLGYGVWKSKPFKYMNACCVSYSEYKMSSDFSEKNIGYMSDFDYNRYLPFITDCKYESYDDEGILISDLKAGVLDGILCTNDLVEKYINIDDNLRVNDMLDSNIYEYVVMSENIELINNIDKIDIE